MPTDLKTFVIPGYPPHAEQTNNVYLLGNTLIDASYGHPPARDVLRTLIEGGGPERILLTHLHPDHCRYAPELKELTGATLAAHPADLVTNPAMRGAIDEPLEDGTLVRAGGATLRALHTPGHSPGHLCFYWEEKEILFSGDMILGEGTVWVGPPYGSIPDYMESLERLGGLSMTKILPGHGPAVGDPAAKVEEYVEHRRMRERQILEELEAGERLPREMVKKIYRDVDEKLHFLAELTVRGHLEKLVRDGLAIGEKEGGLDVFRPAK